MINRKIWLPFVLIVSSCFEEDKPLMPYNGSVAIIDNNIEYIQSYFDFETNTVIDTFPVNVWALGFSCKPSGYNIITNSGNNWFLFNTSDSLIPIQNIPPETAIWEFDRQSAYPDSTAVGEWFTINNNDTTYYNNIYVLGHYIGNDYDEKYLIRFLKVTPEEYLFYFEDMLKGGKDSVYIPKNPDKNFVYFFPAGNEIIDSEPGYPSYDIVFAPYYKITTQIGITAPYLVRGALLNTVGTMAVIDSLTPYSSITSNQIHNYSFTTKKDLIGFDWKEVFINQTTGTASYQIKDIYSYIVHTQEGNYYKIRFLDYQLNSENGFPSFEFEKLLN